MNTIISILDSNFFVAITALFVGGFAIYLYKKQKNDYKRDAALLILQEIRYAEQQVRSSQTFSPNSETFPLSGVLLPTNSWYKNIHLFINDFEQPQIDAVSRFYSQVEYIDHIISKISDHKTSIIERVISDLSGRVVKKEDIFPERMYLHDMNLLMSQGNYQRGQNEQNINMPQNLNQPPQPLPVYNIKTQLMANNILREVSSEINFIYNTPIGEKFRNIAAK